MWICASAPRTALGPEQRQIRGKSEAKLRGGDNGDNRRAGRDSFLSPDSGVGPAIPIIMAAIELSVEGVIIAVMMGVAATRSASASDPLGFCSVTQRNACVTLA